MPSLTTFSKRFAPPSVVQEGRSGESVVEFARRVNPRFRVYRHNSEIFDVLEAVLRGEILDLMVWMPPGTGKSETVSRLFSAYCTFAHPIRTVGVTSYGASLAQEMTRDAREYYVDAGGKLDPSQRAKTRWRTLSGGGMWGAGFGGAVRGMRYHHGLTDDPHKNYDDIASDLKRERLFRWWDNTWMNRGQLFSDTPVTRTIVMQRLADNDLCGWLLSRPDADKWTILALDAVHDLEPFQGQDVARFLPDWRSEGEVLCPEILTPKVLAERQADPDNFAAIDQQRPRAVGGRVLDPAWFRLISPSKVPPMLRKVIGVDLAVSKKQSADYTVGFPLGVGPDLSYYLFRPYRERHEAPVARGRIAATARIHQAAVVAVESVAFQLAFVQELRAMREMIGFSVVEADADRDKLSRARGWSHLAFQGRMFLVEDGSGWTTAFLDECRRFPRGPNDDQIDAVGIAITAIRALPSGDYKTGGKQKPALQRL